MANPQVNATVRTVTGKKVSNLRKAGIIPVVVYGNGIPESLSLQVTERELRRVLAEAGGETTIDLTVDGETYHVRAHKVQRHITRNDLVHVDFLAQ